MVPRRYCSGWVYPNRALAGGFLANKQWNKPDNAGQGINGASLWFEHLPQVEELLFRCKIFGDSGSRF